jgi:hypothetical protein
VVVLPEKLGKFREGDGVVFQVKLEAGATNLMGVPLLRIHGYGYG